ncbi:MAG TPA: hypothetical protein VMJ10_19320 [Kofleriaceae bacterium]|nr:hypothetical protein [Kofleriaceae bacterium]
MSRIQCIVLAAAATACGHNEAKDSPPTAASAPPTATVQAPVAAPPPMPEPDVQPMTCEQRAAHLDQRLHALASHSPGFLPMVQAIHEPKASVSNNAFDARGVVIAIARDGQLYAQGAHFASLAEAADYLDAREKEALEKLAMGGGGLRDARWPLYIWADDDVAAGAVAALAAKTTGTHWTPRLLVTAHGGYEHDRETTAANAVAAKLPVSEPDATKYVADQLRAAIAPCKEIVLALGTADLEGIPDRIAEKLAKDVPAGLAKCKCALARIDIFEWGMHQWFGDAGPELAWIDLPKLVAGDKRTLGTLVK